MMKLPVLIKMELKRLRAVIFSLSLVMILAHTVRFVINYRMNENIAYFRGLSSSARSAFQILFQLDRTVYFMIPAVLAFFLVIDWKSKSKYQEAFLPLVNPMIILAKITAILCVCVIVTIVDRLSNALSHAVLLAMNDGSVVYYNFKGMGAELILGSRALNGMGAEMIVIRSSAAALKKSIPDVFFGQMYGLIRMLPHWIIQYTIICFFYSSLVVLAHTVMITIKRRLAFIWTATFLTGLALIPYQLKPFLMYFSTKGGIDYVLTVAFSVVYLGVGMYLNERYTEI